MISEREYEKWSLSVLIKNFPNVDINILQAIQEYALHKNCEQKEYCLTCNTLLKNNDRPVNEWKEDETSLYCPRCKEWKTGYTSYIKEQKGCGELFEPRHFGFCCGDFNPLKNEIILCDKCKENVTEKTNEK